MRREFLVLCVAVGLLARASVGLAQELQFSVKPENQPQNTASAQTMQQYSSLNQRLADATDEPASTCLKSYAVYQGCKAGETPATCGAAPSCTAVAPLPEIDLAGIRLNFPAGQDTTVLVPHAPRPVIDPAKVKFIHEEGPPTGAAGTGVGVSPPIATTSSEPAPPVSILPRGPARISGGVIAGFRTSFVQPKYPQAARIARLSGTVTLRAIISKTGAIQNLEVASTSNTMFDNAAIDAVRHWSYRPYILNGEPTEIDTTITVNFQMSQPKPAAEPH